MVDIERRRVVRALVMNSLFEAADGSEWTIIDLNSLGEELGLSEAEVGEAAKYLEGENLIVGIWALGSLVPQAHLTHWGIREVEEQRLKPNVPTEHFPAFNVIHVEGSIVNSPVQQGTFDSTQMITYGGELAEQLTKFVAQTRERFFGSRPQ